MLPVHTILHPTDFSDQSQHAFQFACALARDYRARLVLLHVVDRPVTTYAEGFYVPDTEAEQQEARTKLDQLEAGQGFTVERKVVEGDPIGDILRVAEECRCDLIVMGTHGRRGLARLLMGSVAELVVRRASCPVLTVKTPMPLPAEEQSLLHEELVSA